MMDDFEKIRAGLAHIKVVPQFRPMADSMLLQINKAEESPLEDTIDLQLSA
jgi:hypothetical protein